MKRNLCLSAVALACAASVHAQSSVTMWGIVDVNVQHFKAEGNGSVNAIGNGSLSTSQLGFRGSEDLGGGLRANFWLEGSINPDNGTGRTTNLNNQPSGTGTAPAGTQGFLFDRRAYVGLSSNYGELRLGHDFVPTHYNSISFDPFNANGVARAGNFTFSGSSNGSLSTTITASNSVGYLLPTNLGGVYGQVMYAAGENQSSVANPDDGTLFSGRLGWTNGKFDVAAAASHTLFAKTATIGSFTHQNVGASYNFGFAKLFALYNRVNVDVLAGSVRKQSWELGATIPAGPGPGRVRVTYANLNDVSGSKLLNANGSARSGNDANMWGLGYVYDLSKRTALYATYASISNKGGATYAVSGGPAPIAAGTSTGIEAGVRTSF
ncbi:porin [Ramlibacter sp. G-1-2-2]|uniref:Porin n=1 Tax=Ramlibacter agri TaxID=2728837 RepID=A0A848H505_9BURK|nr:porin [Ramlibacter agri]